MNRIRRVVTALLLGGVSIACGSSSSTPGSQTDAGMGGASGRGGSSGAGTGGSSATGSGGSAGRGGSFGTGGTGTGGSGAGGFRLDAGFPFDASALFDSSILNFDAGTCADLAPCCSRLSGQQQAGCNALVSAGVNELCSVALQAFRQQGTCL